VMDQTIVLVFMNDVIFGFASQRMSQVSNLCAAYEKQRWENPHQNESNPNLKKNQTLPKPEPNKSMWFSHL